MPRSKRARRLALSGVAAAIVIFAFVGYWLVFRPRYRPLTVSPETTILTGPLNPDGSVDYIAALNNRRFRSVRPAENAAMLLIRIQEPKSLFPEPSRGRILEIMGLERQRPTTKFVEIDAFAESHPEIPDIGREVTISWDPDLEMWEGVDGTIYERPEIAPPSTTQPATRRKLWVPLRPETCRDGACAAPWTLDETPLVAGWLQANADVLDLVVRASRRPVCVWPTVAPADVPQRLFYAVPPQILIPRVCYRLLAARAMLKAGQGDFGEARQDLLAAHRLLRAIASQSASLLRLSCIAQEHALLSTERNLAATGRFAPEQLAQLGATLGELPALLPIADAIDTLERYLKLDLIATLSSSKRVEDEIASSYDIATGELPAIDWNETAKRVNLIIDDAVAAAREPDYRHRMRAIGILAKRLQERKQQLTGKTGGKEYVMDSNGEFQRVDEATPLATFAKDPAVLLTVDTVSALRGYLQLEQRLLAAGALTRVALTLAAHKARHGAYPERLSHLAPTILDPLPDDPFTGKQLGYRRTKTGYVLWSAGEDLVDDGAAADSDDVSVRPDPFVPHHQRPVTKSHSR